MGRRKEAVDCNLTTITYRNFNLLESNMAKIWRRGCRSRTSSCWAIRQCHPLSISTICTIRTLIWASQITWWIQYWILCKAWRQSSRRSRNRLKRAKFKSNNKHYSSRATTTPCRPPPFLPVNVIGLPTTWSSSELMRPRGWKARIKARLTRRKW